MRKYLLIISNLCNKRICNSTWLLLAFIPFKTSKWVKYLKDIQEIHFNLNVSEIENLKNEPMAMEQADWLLLLEQYDHQDGSHYGSRFVPLNEAIHQHYNIITPISGAPIQPDEIRIRETLNRTNEGKRWATLQFDFYSKIWHIQDLAYETMLIPVIYQKENEEPEIEICSLNGTTSKPLRHNCRFIVNGNEFHLIKLPPLSIYWEDLQTGKWCWKTLHRNRVAVGNKVNLDISITRLEEEIAFRIHGNRLYPYGKITYFNHVLGHPYELDSDSDPVRLQPGDWIKLLYYSNIGNLTKITPPTEKELIFYIDYLYEKRSYDS